MVFCLVTRNCYSCTISVPPCVLSLDTRNYYFCPKWHSFVLRVSDETNFPNDNNRGDHVPVIILAVYSYVFLDFVSVWPKTENIYIYNIYICILCPTRRKAIFCCRPRLRYRGSSFWDFFSRDPESLARVTPRSLGGLELLWSGILISRHIHVNPHRNNSSHAAPSISRKVYSSVRYRVTRASMIAQIH